MTAFIQLIAGVLVGLILWVVLSRYSKDAALLLSLAACIMAFAAAASYIKPVLTFLKQLQDISGMDDSLFAAVLKALGVGLISEITALVCSDAGNAALGKAVQIFSASVIIWLSIPLMTALLDLVGELVGKF